MNKFYTIKPEDKCQYPDCTERAYCGWGGKLYCEFHFRVVRRARSNKLKSKFKEKGE